MQIYIQVFFCVFFPLSEVKLHPLIGTLRLKQILLRIQRKCFKIRFLFFNISLWDIGKNQTFPREAYPSPPSIFFFFLNFWTILLLSSRPKPLSQWPDQYFFCDFCYQWKWVSPNFFNTDFRFSIFAAYKFIL